MQTKNAALGSMVTITVTADVNDEVHVHGYDEKVDLTAGTPGSVTFTADIPGQFEVELDNTHLRVLELQVSYELAMRSQYPLLAVMVANTVGGLAILLGG